MRFLSYTTVTGDRWDLIAFRMYGVVTNFAGIIDANPQVAIDAVLPLGLELAIPVIRKPVATVPSPPWLLVRGQ